MIKLVQSLKSESFASTLIKITAAIPCYNTQNHIEDVVTETIKYVDDVIVVDDGSTDMTASLASKAGAVVIKHLNNRGKGAAMKTAAEIAKADIIVFMDGDGQHSPSEIPQLIKPILDGNADYVIGSRYLQESSVSSRPLKRKMASTAASIIISLVISIIQPTLRFVIGKSLPKKSSTGNPVSQIANKPTNTNIRYRLLNGRFKWITDSTSGFIAVKAANWDKLDLISNGFEIETEMIFEQSIHDFIIAETPISCRWGESTSNLSIIRDGTKTILLLIKKLINLNN